MTYRCFLLAVLSVTALAWQATNAESLNLDSTHQIFHFHGIDPESGIGEFIQPLGDINNDGFDDIACNSYIPNGVYIFFGSEYPDTLYDYFLDNVEVIGKVYDYDGDGSNDLIASNDSAIYIYNIVDGSPINIPTDSILLPEGMTELRIMDSRDINNNGMADILVRDNNPYEGHRVHLYYDPFWSDKIPDWSYLIEEYSHAIKSCGFIDYNADGIDDIYIQKSADLDTESYIDIYLGGLYKQPSNLVIGHPEEYNDSLDKEYFALAAFNIADVNGDGFEDLGVMSAPDVPRNTIYLGGPNTDTLQDYWLDASGLYMTGVGDINSDGYNDLAIGGSETYSGQIIIYLGGPGFNEQQDDYIGQNDLPPYFLYRIGDPVASAGDFNGDGINDILFHAGMAAGGSYGHVFVFSGDTGLVVNVSDSNQPLPYLYELHQNYPNPFNISTTIKFSISFNQHVELTIYNLLGEKVVTLINTALRAGAYSAKWQGRNENNQLMSSGIYIYSIHTNEYSLAKKMVLIK